MSAEVTDTGESDRGVSDMGTLSDMSPDLPPDLDTGLDAGLDTDLDIEPIAPLRDYPLDDQLRLNHVQALGTHNSYHLASEIDALPWRYSHLPLDEQLGQQGVRQFELDIYEREGELRVYHIERIDENTTCETLAECLRVMRAWSDRNPQHQPILTLLEVKSTERSAPEMVEALEATLRETWGEEKLLTPRLVQRDYPTLRAGLEAEGWPTLGETRGRLLAVLHSGGGLRRALVNNTSSSEGVDTVEGDLGDRLLFPDAYGDLEAPFAAYHSMNDPVSGFDRIQGVVRAGHVVRTRSDVDGEPTLTLDYSRAETALESGAQWISTDYPDPPSADRYGFVIPEGEPARCNPLTAPPECAPRDVE